MEKNKELLLKSIEQLVDSKKQDSTSIQFEEFVYIWKIVNFKHYSDVYLFSKIESPWFSIPNQKFELKIILRNDEKEKYLALNIEHNLYKYALKQKMRFEVSLLDEDKKERIVQNKLMSTTNWGYGLPSFPEFVPKDLIFKEKNGLLPNGSLIINCKIYFGQKCVNYPRPVKAFNEMDLLKYHQNKFKKILENGKFSDVTLVIDDEEFNVHKNILSTHSPVFSAMFEHKMKERNGNTVLISDIRPEVMKEVLNYIYSGEFDNFESLGKDILTAADKYEIDGLRILCEEKFINDLRMDNVAEMLTIIDSCDTMELKKYVLEFLQNVEKNFFKTKEFHAVTKLLSASLLTEIFETLSL